MDDGCAGEIRQNPNKEEFNDFKVVKKNLLKIKNLCLGFMEMK